MAYLHVAGVNLNRLMEDTQDLSTIRGTSLLYLDIIQALSERLETEFGARTISTGASVGIWELEDAEGAGRKAREWLNAGKQPPLDLARHLSFTVAYCDNGNMRFPEIRNFLTNQSRIQQLCKQLLPVCEPGTLPVPARFDIVAVDGSSDGETARDSVTCQLDLVRPRCDQAQRIKDGWRWVSKSVSERRAYGVRKKQSFYSHLLGEDRLSERAKDHEALPFALSFESLMEWENDPDGLRQPKGVNAADKIAVLYFDGNQFSAIQDSFARTPERHREFDGAIHDFRAELLTNILDLIESDPIGTGPPAPDEAEERKALDKKVHDGKGIIRTDRVIRMETLLWGGDDLMIIVPARLGLEVVKVLYALQEDYANGHFAIGGHDIHHAAALVLCHHNAPIQRIKDLAGDLCHDAKSAAASDGTSRLAFAVMESFDHTGGSSQIYWDRRAPGCLDKTNLILTPEQITRICSFVQELKSPCFDGEPYPSRRLHNLARAIHRTFALHRELDFDAGRRALALDFPSQEGDIPESLRELARATADAHRRYRDELEKLMEPVEAADITPAAAFLLAEELWDYVREAGP